MTALTTACTCQTSASCSTCTTWRVIFDTVADRQAERVERAMQDRAIALMLARQHSAAHRRPVRDIPRRLRIDLDALADAVALRLRRQG